MDTAQDTVSTVHIHAAQDAAQDTAHTGLLVGAQRPFDERRPASRVGAAAFARRRRGGPRRGGPATFGCRAGGGDPLQVYGGGVALQVYGVVVLTDVPLQASVRSLAVAGRCLLRVRVG